MTRDHSQKTLYHCYIDESGDEGFRFGRGSSEWFFLTGVVVKADDEAQVRGTVEEIFERAWINVGNRPPPMLHWRKLDHKKKVVAVQELTGKPFVFCTVGMWKTRLTQAGYIRQSGNLFRYASRFLLERISWFVDDNDGHVIITFSNRNRFQPELLRSYIIQILLTGHHQIRQVFDPSQIQVRNNRQFRMLQVADVCAGASIDAFCPDAFGNCHPGYLQEVSPHLYRRGGKLFSYGLKMFPDGVFLASYPTLYPFVKEL